VHYNAIPAVRSKTGRRPIKTSIQLCRACLVVYGRQALNAIPMGVSVSGLGKLVTRRAFDTRWNPSRKGRGRRNVVVCDVLYRERACCKRWRS
jgi:hypothetical protein